jgi:hypothetical protein
MDLDRVSKENLQVMVVSLSKLVDISVEASLKTVGAIRVFSPSGAAYYDQIIEMIKKNHEVILNPPTVDGEKV